MTNAHGKLLQCPECGSTDIQEDEGGKFCGTCKGPISETNTMEMNKLNGDPPKKAKRKTPANGKAGKKTAKRKSKVVSKSTTRTKNPLKSEKKQAKPKSDNPFASKLDEDSGKEIETMFLAGKGWREIATGMGVTVNSVRFRFLQFLIDKSYGKKR